MVSGTGRSGTNVTKKIFAQHSDVATLPFEYRFIIDPRGVIDFYNSYPQIWSPYWPDARIKDFTDYLRSLAQLSDEKISAIKEAKESDSTGLKISPPPYSGWELNEWIPGFSEYIDQLETDLTSFRYPGIWPGTKGGIHNNKMLFAPPRSKEDLQKPISEFLEKCFSSILKKQGKEVFLEDNTHNILFADDLLDLIPNGKLLHIIRDPRDVISSLKAQRWTPNEIPQLIQWYQSVMERWHEISKNLDSNRFKVVRFEDLVHHTKTVLEDICGFFKIELEPLMLEVDLSKHNIGRYTHDFSDTEIQSIENQLKEVFVRYEY